MWWLTLFRISLLLKLFLSSDIKINSLLNVTYKIELIVQTCQDLMDMAHS